MKLSFPLSLFISLLFVSCSAYIADYNGDSPADTPTNKAEAQINISVPQWENALSSRAADDEFTPVHVLFVPNSAYEVAHSIECTDNNYSIKLEPGFYDIFAVCGLPTENLPKSSSDNITFPDGDKGKKCIAIGGKPNYEIKANLQNDININATRQNSWLSLQLTDVPDIINSVKIYAVGLYDIYTLESGWELSIDGAKVYTELPMTQSASVGSTYECDRLINPCLSKEGVKYAIEARTTNNKTAFYEYTSTAKLLPGKHHVQTIKFSELSLANGSITVENWGSSSEDGAITDKLNFKAGDRYFAYPATVLQVASTAISIFPHKAMTVKLAEVKAWTNFSDINYSLLPDLAVSRWAFPTLQTAPNSLKSLIQSNGLDEINKQLKASGNPTISASDTNILAYYDKTADKFYRYDFENFKLVAIEGLPTDDYLLYPFGMIEF